MKIYSTIEELIGNTPLFELKKYAKSLGLKARIVAKLEWKNPGGSIKDRVAKAMLDEAEKRGEIAEGSVIIEPTSGNTGVGLAAVGSARGYRVILTMPDSMSLERRQLLEAYGAELVLTPGSEGMSGAIAKAEELSRELPGSFIAGQFTNPANPRAHYEGTGPEIWRDTCGEVDIFVAGAGTGGTVSGAGRYLKEQNGKVKVVAVEPDTSAVLSGGEAGPHGIQGIGAGFIPETMDMGVCDEVIPVSLEASYEEVRALAESDGLLIGISGGAALHAARQLAEREENAGKLIVVIFPDSGERYMSTGLFEQE